MQYPEPDRNIIEAANAKRASFLAASEQTRLNIRNAEAALGTTMEERSRVLNMLAAGAPVPQGKLDEAERAVSANEASLRQQREILTIQEGGAKDAQAELQKSYGLAQRPRVIAAIREMHEAGKEAAAARSALHAAENRDAEARKVIMDAFGHGFPLPRAFSIRQDQIWMGVKLPAATHATALRATWGDLADEALASIAEATA